MTLPDITATPQWDALEEHRDALSHVTLREHFAADPTRGRSLNLVAADLHIDYSKNHVTPETIRLLSELAHAAGVAGRRDEMFAGVHINNTEDRAVLHTALRLPEDATLIVDGQDVVADVHAVLRAMREFVTRLRTGEWTGHTGRRIETVVNIGIGGSDLGPAMAARALRRYATAGISARFISNVDPADVVGTLADLDPETTLFIVASKTFTTQETIANAHAAKRWLLEGLGAGDEAVASHFVAVSTNAERVAEFGIDTANMFGFWDWVGGRFSVSSAIGLSLMALIGPRDFERFLEGMRRMDEHFLTTAFEHNAPVLMAMIGVWYADFLDAPARAVIPYSEDLGRFTSYLQQLLMESVGKSVRIDGSPVTCGTGEVYFGEPGTNGQHAFFQLLHQGTRKVPCEFIGFAEPGRDVAAPDGAQGMHDLLMSNLFAQSRVLAFGETADELGEDGVEPGLVPHKVMPGDRPSTTILGPKLTPGVLGQLIALYEHIVFVQSVVWGINAFDQWGVELGKRQAGELLPLLTAESRPASTGLDSSTDHLVQVYRRARGRN